MVTPMAGARNRYRGHSVLKALRNRFFCRTSASITSPQEPRAWAGGFVGPSKARSIRPRAGGCQFRRLGFSNKFPFLYTHPEEVLPWPPPSTGSPGGQAKKFVDNQTPRL